MRAVVSKKRKVFGLSEGVYFVIPATICITLVLLFPLLYAFYLAFMRELPGFVYEFVWLENFARVLSDQAFWRAFSNTFIFSVATVLCTLVLGLGLALLLNRNLKGTFLFRLLLFIPWMIAPVVAGVDWRWMFNANYGFINHLGLSLGLLSEKIAWLGTPKYALPATLVANIWRNYPMTSIILLAGLKAVPKDQYEAAEIDGAGMIARFFNVTLPNLRQVILVATTLQFIWSFKTFDIISVMTNGGPAGHTEVLSTLVHRTGFMYFDFPTASAIAMMMVLIVFLVSVMYIRFLAIKD